MSKSYSRGVLLWIDDYYWETISDGGDIEAWRSIFGNAESRVYRLLGLQLEIAMSYEAARKTIDRYQLPEFLSTYVTAVVDLRIPRDLGGQPDIKFGLKIAKLLQDRGIPFVFLSNMSAAQEKLRYEGLESVPYYQKQSSVDSMFMPEELMRSILTEFRNHINWINLGSLSESIGSSKGFSLLNERDYSIENEHFPFFGAFRDFVERWENRPYPSGNDVTFVLRSPLDHCDEFVQQCCLLVLSQYLHLKNNVDINFISPNAVDYFLNHQGEVNKRIAAFRLDPEHNSADQLKDLVRIRERTTSHTIFIIPNDESADEYLECLPRRKNVIYDDLPLIRLGDSASREELIRNVSSYIFQEARIVMDEGDASLSPLYIKFPELLIHPLNWIALMENEYVDASLSDPYEVLGFLSQASSELQDFDTPSKQALLEGHPLDPDKLLKVANEIVEKSTSLHFVWWQRMIDVWLRTSWHFPYALADKIRVSDIELDSETWEEWEDFCLDIIDYTISKNRALFKNKGEVLPQVSDAVSFFESHAVNKLLDDKMVDENDWEELASKRWPHPSYPLPSSLGKKLKRAGRHSWIQNDYMDLAMAFPVGKRESRHLNYLTEEFGARLSWLEEVSSALPSGWQESIDHLVRMIKTRSVRAEWNNNPDKVWDSFLTILRNATPISLVFNFALANKPLAGKEKAPGRGKNSAEYELSNTDGYGKIHGMIRGGRKLAREALQFEDKSLGVLSESLSHFVHYGLLGKRYADMHIGLGQSHKLRELPMAIHDVFNIPNGDNGLDEVNFEVYQNIQDVVNEFMCGKQSNWFPFFGDDKRRETKQFVEHDWCKGLENTGIGNFTSQLATKADYMFHALDMLNDARFVSMPLRNYDGYPLIAILGDIRNKNKDSRPQVSVDVIEELLEVFVWSVEGLIAQLKFCLDLAGCKEASERIVLHNINIEPPSVFARPKPEEVAAVLKIVEGDRSSIEVFGLGIPGKNTANEYCYHISDSTKKFERVGDLLLQPQMV